MMNRFTLPSLLRSLRPLLRRRPHFLLKTCRPHSTSLNLNRSKTTTALVVRSHLLLIQVLLGR